MKKIRVPTGQLSVRQLKREGYTQNCTQQWVPPGIYKDLFGVFDRVAIRKGCTGVLGIQETTVKHMRDRANKMVANPALLLWLECGNHAEIWGWEMVEHRYRQKVWKLECHTGKDGIAVDVVQ